MVTDSKKLYGYTKISGDEKVAVILNFNTRKSEKVDVKTIFGTEKVFDLYNEIELEGEVEIGKQGFLLVTVPVTK